MRAALLALAVACLPLPARAQAASAPGIEPPPAVTYWQADPALRAVRVSGLRGCAVWFYRPADRFAGWVRAMAAADLGLLAAAQVQALADAVAAQDAGPLIAARTHRLDAPELQAASAPCRGIATPAGPWIIAPIASGSRPMYSVAPDGTLGPQATPRATAGVRADCRRRVVRGASVYCAVAGDASGLVALAREVP